MTTQPQLSPNPADAPGPVAPAHGSAAPATGPDGPGEDSANGTARPTEQPTAHSPAAGTGTGTASTKPGSDRPAPAPSGLSGALGDPAPKPLLIGFLGTLLMAFGGLGAGGILVHDPVLSGTPLSAWRFGHGYDLAVVLVYLGLVLLVWAWVMLGRDVLAHRATGRGTLTTALLWIVPMLVSPPMFTRDPYSYLAQGAMPLTGLDPYGGGPNELGPGPWLDNVHWFWQDTPAPYGPLFILIAKGIVSLTGTNMIVGVLLMKATMAVGLVLFVAALPGLTRHLGGRLPMALWVAVANPVMVVHLVGGPHNDLLVVGLVALGSLLALNRRHVAGIALVTLAMAVKATAGVALPFLVLVWAARLTGSRRARITKAAAAGIAVFLPLFAACGWVAGVGLGWLPALSAPSSIVNWLSLSTGPGEFVFTVVNWVVGGLSKTPFITVTRIIGAVALFYHGVRHWLIARDTGGADAVRRAGVVLMLVALLSPSTLPWYYSWGMGLLAAASFWTARRMQLVILGSALLLAFAFPDGEVALYSLGFLILMMGGAVLAAISLRRPDPLGLRSRPASDPPGTAESPADAAPVPDTGQPARPSVAATVPAGAEHATAGTGPSA